MIEWYFIVISIIIVVYVSCWLGVEMIAYNLGYQMTHLQMFFIPAVCILAAFGILLSSNNVFIGIQGYILNSQRFIKFHFTRNYSNRLLLAEYLFHGGKLSLCMWAVYEVCNNKNKGEASPLKAHYLLQVLEVIEEKVVERSFPILKDLTYSVSITLNTISAPFVKIPKKSRKSTVKLSNDSICNEVVWNYVR